MQVAGCVKAGLGHETDTGSGRLGRMIRYFVRVAEKRPPFARVARFLWGADIDFDSDGNSTSLEDGTWTELTVVDRRNGVDRVDVDPVEDEPLIMNVRSENATLAARAAYYLAMYAKGSVAQDLAGPYREPDAMVEAMGAFDIERALLAADLRVA